MKKELMPKKVFYDAIMVKWVIEEVYEPETNDKFTYFWIHVDGDNEPQSGFVGDTLLDVIDEFIEGGYLDPEED